MTLDGRRTINEANLFVTYGCPFECTFCSSPILVGRNEKTGVPAYRRPDMQRIVDDVEHVVTDLGADAVHFLDDMAFISSTHIRELDDELVARDLKGKFIWRGLTRAPVIDRFTDDDMRLMKDTGAWKIALGVESGNDEILRAIRKKVKVEQVVRAVARLGKNRHTDKGLLYFWLPWRD
jgi:anaerobic magnesium-protoporphyrin IX monomethyl ester cyclase